MGPKLMYPAKKPTSTVHPSSPPRQQVPSCQQVPQRPHLQTRPCRLQHQAAHGHPCLHSHHPPRHSLIRTRQGLQSKRGKARFRQYGKNVLEIASNKSTRAKDEACDRATRAQQARPLSACIQKKNEEHSPTGSCACTQDDSRGVSDVSLAGRVRHSVAIYG